MDNLGVEKYLNEIQEVKCEYFWVMNSKSWDKLRGLKDSLGNFAAMPNRANPLSPIDWTFFGLRVVINEDFDNPEVCVRLPRYIKVFVY